MPTIDETARPARTRMANPNCRLPGAPLVPRVGFDILADSVRAIQRSLRTEAVPLAATASSAVGRKVKSSFVEGLGKRAKAAVSGAREDEGAARRRVTVASRRMSDNAGAAPDEDRRARRVSDNAGAAPDDDRGSTKRPSRGSYADAPDDQRSTKRPSCDSGALVTPSVSGTGLGTTPSRPNNHSTYFDVYEDHIVPAHSSLRPSVLQPVYKRLLPDDIVRLSAGDELIIVIPNSMPGRADAAKAADIAGVCEFYRKAFFAVGRETAGRHLARQDVEDQHRLRREDRWFHEYPVRVRAYAEREHFSREYVEERSVMFSWGQGAGLSLEVCGYSVARTVLLQFRHVAYLEIYGRAAPDAFLNNAIEFNDTRNVDSLSAPFVEQLSLVNGCRFGTVEVLWKYYRALNSSHRRTAARVAARAARAANAISPDESSKWDDFMPDDPEYCLSLIRLELDDENIDRFVLFVDNLYKESFVAVYTEFVIPDGFLLDRRSIAEMYRLMQRLFPFVHSVLALTVSPKSRREGDWVYLSPFLTNGREGHGCSQLDDDPVDGDPVGNDPVNDDTNDDDPVDDDGCPGDDGLTRRERAVLEFFIAKIRVRSQKKMKHWAMIASLGNHSRGQSRIPNHPLHGSGSSMTTVWGTLNHIFETSKAARGDLVAKQYTVSMAFDNWQISVNKMWQNYGCSSKFMRGVATFMKRDKAILLPVGSIMVSPSGVKFKITSSAYLDAYSIVIRGSILESDDRATIGHPTEFAGGNNGSLDAPCPRNADEHRITSGNLIWPAIGWDILLLKGVARCASPLSYTDPVVPPPLNACVLSSVSSDDLLFRPRSFFMSGTENTRQITSTEYYNLSMDVEDLCILDSFACFVSRMTKGVVQARVVH